MSEKLIGEMDHAEFEQMMEAFIDRSSDPDDPIPSELVFAMLDKAEHAGRILEMESTVVGDRLVLSASQDAVIPDSVHEIEVNLPGIKLIVKREPVAA